MPRKHNKQVKKNLGCHGGGISSKNEASALLTDIQPGYRHTSTTIMSSAVATSSRLRIVASIDDVGGQLPDGSLAVVQYGLKALDDLFP